MTEAYNFLDNYAFFHAQWPWATLPFPEKAPRHTQVFSGIAMTSQLLYQETAFRFYQKKQAEKTAYRVPLADFRLPLPDPALKEVQQAVYLGFSQVFQPSWLLLALAERHYRAALHRQSPERLLRLLDQEAQNLENTVQLTVQPRGKNSFLLWLSLLFCFSAATRDFLAAPSCVAAGFGQADENYFLRQQTSVNYLALWVSQVSF